MILLLFDATGEPVPWIATGRFSVTNHGIAEIRRSPTGSAVILHTYLAGHPAWGGVTRVSNLYRVTGTIVSSIKGTYAGIEFPDVVGARENDHAFRQAVSNANLSTESFIPGSSEKTQAVPPRFVRYGADSARPSESQAGAALTAEQAANLTVDTAAFNAGIEHLVLSDGSRLDLPSILVVDSTGGTRKIFFSADGEDLAPLEKGSYSVRQSGEDCLGADGCHPFRLHAVEQNP